MDRPHTLALPRTPTLLLGVAALLGLLAALVVAVSASAAGSGVRVDVRKTALGRVLVTAQGRTLYLFAPDKHGKSTCYGSCATYWPPLLTSAKPSAGAGVTASMLGTTKRSDGKLQVTYDHHPLYRYAADAKAGQTSGEGVNASGGLWWAVSPAGAAVHKSSSSSSGGGGGGHGGGGGYG
jgi:predicted lipoprotein with Yx(FWY)xxD motif